MDNTELEWAKKSRPYTALLASMIGVVRAARWDLAIVSLLVATAFGLCWWGASQLSWVLQEPEGYNLWFESDSPRLFSAMTDRMSDHSRTKVHPLLSIITYVPVRALTFAFSLAPLHAVRAYEAVVAGLWIALMFLALRLAGLKRPDATVFTVLGSTSAAAVFWFVVPETFALGSTTILVGLCAAAARRTRRVGDKLLVVVSAITLSVTITNWMVGIVASAATQSVKRSVEISLCALGLVTLAWGIQKTAFPTAVFFLGDREEAQYVLLEGARGPSAVASSFALHTMVMPAIRKEAVPTVPEWPVLNPQLRTQGAVPGAATGFGAIAVCLWSGLLVMGVYALWSLKGDHSLRLTLAIALSGQLLLHLLYGNETFLYALHFLPLLIMVAALATRTRFRPHVLLAAVALIPCLAVNNVHQFRAAVRHLNMLTGARMPGAGLQGENLSNRVLEGVDLRGAELTGTNLAGAFLGRAVLDAACLERADLSRAFLGNANLRSARLAEAKLNLAWLRSADLREADLTQVQADGANFEGAILGGATLRGASLRRAKLRRVDLKGADLQRGQLAGADLRDASLCGANLSHSDLSGVRLDGADLSGAILTGAGFAGASLRHANLVGVDLSGADLLGPDLTGARYDEHTRWPAAFDPLRWGASGR